MMVIPWLLVKSLRLDINMEDREFDLVTASGSSMTVLGTMVIYLHPKGLDTRQVNGLVTDNLGNAEILQSYSDKKDLSMLSEAFPKLPLD